MYLPKEDIYKSLKELNVGVSQSQPTKFNELPYINFSISNNDVELDLNNDILYQTIDVKIDIWSKDSVTASELLSKVEEKMRKKLYRMTYSADIPNVGNVYHIVSRFKAMKGE